MSVPQIAVLAISISTRRLGRPWARGCPPIQIPGSACFFDQCFRIYDRSCVGFFREGRRGPFKLSSRARGPPPR